MLPITLTPEDEVVFRDTLLKTRLAWIATHFADGQVKTDIPLAELFRWSRMP
jgi:hypothetical protein